MIQMDSAEDDLVNFANQLGTWTAECRAIQQLPTPDRLQQRYTANTQAKQTDIRIES